MNKRTNKRTKVDPDVKVEIEVFSKTMWKKGVDLAIFLWGTHSLQWASEGFWVIDITVSKHQIVKEKFDLKRGVFLKGVRVEEASFEL